MKYYFSSYWYLNNKGSYGVGQTLFKAECLNILLIELSIKKINKLEKVILLSANKITKKEYVKNKRIEYLLLEV